jgi:tetratricopeptide (TPR) repeat protein
MRDEFIQPDVVTYSTLINLAPDYEEAKALLKQMRDEFIQPNVITYSTFINLAPDYEEAKALLKQMRDEFIQPNVITYDTLINLAPDYEEAKALLKQMRDEFIEPNVVTYNTLINLAPDYEEAKALLKQMRNEQIQLNEYTYSTLFSKKPQTESADRILAWYWSQAYHPEGPVQALIATYRKSGQLSQALFCALHYAHLDAARSLIRRFENEAYAYFKLEYDKDPNHPSAAYALGVALMELERDAEAKEALEKALTLTAVKPRQVAIRGWMNAISAKQTTK